MHDSHLSFSHFSASFDGCHWRLVLKVNELDLHIRTLLRKSGNTFLMFFFFAFSCSLSELLVQFTEE